MKKIICIILALSMLMSCAAIFASCNEEKEESDNGLKIVNNGKSEYVIVRGDNASETVSDAVVTLKKAINEAYGVNMTINTDYIPRNEENPVIPKYEILVGKTNRNESNGVTEGLGEMQFVIKAVGDKLVICGATDKMTSFAVGYFIRNYINKEEKDLLVATDFSKTATGDYSYCSSTGLTFEEMARQVYEDFMDKFWKGRWVQGSGFWDAAEILETFIDAYEATKDEKYLTYVKQYAASFETRNGSNWLNNEFNDDVMWITIAYLRIYLLTGEDSYYKQAKSMYDGVYRRAWSDDLGGGLFWKTDNKSKNACVNCPAAIAASYIAQISGDEKYTTQAKDIIGWVVSTLYEENGHVYDSINLEKEINNWASTYNQGTFIGACMLIYQNTNEQIYMDYANAAAEYTMKNMFNYGVMNSEEGGNDLPGFKGILTRWIYRFAKYTDNKEILEWLQYNAATAYSNRNKNGLIWTQWKNKTADVIPEEHNVFGYSTAVALMFNSLQWWETVEEEQ